jgi:hypothetical protein
MKFIVAKNASWPNLFLECMDPQCDYAASAFIGNIWQDSVRIILEQESINMKSLKPAFNLVEAGVNKFLLKYSGSKGSIIGGSSSCLLRSMAEALACRLGAAPQAARQWK